MVKAIISHRRASVLLFLLVLLTQSVFAGPREQARRLHDRIAGVPPDAAVLDAMESAVASGDPGAAARIAMENPSFYDVTIRNLATPWSNRDRTRFAPLNDYTATVVGMVRDDVGFDNLLSADLVYVADPAAGLPPYSMNSNAHYEALSDSGLALADVLVAAPQSAVSDLPASAAAGVMTTRAAAEAFFVAGTNRAMFRFTLLNHLCHDMEQVNDTTLPPDRIRQDVSRSPGGDSRIFLNNCIGCHSGMDPMAQAFAYYDWDAEAERIVYSPGQVRPKYSINAENFRYGFVTGDDGWDNYWRAGRNNALGWDEALPGSGQGAASMGAELARSDAFASCQVEKVFQDVCFRAPGDAADRSLVAQVAEEFRTTGYRLKQVFEDTAVYCMGE